MQHIIQLCSEFKSLKFIRSFNCDLLAVFADEMQRLYQIGAEG